MTNGVVLDNELLYRVIKRSRPDCINSKGERQLIRIDKDDDIVKRIIRIPAEKKADYIRHLDFLGINKARLFPENWDLQCEIVKDEVM